MQSFFGHSYLSVFRFSQSLPVLNYDDLIYLSSDVFLFVRTHHDISFLSLNGRYVFDRGFLDFLDFLGFPDIPDRDDDAFDSRDDIAFQNIVGFRGIVGFRKIVCFRDIVFLDVHRHDVDACCRFVASDSVAVAVVVDGSGSHSRIQLAYRFVGHRWNEHCSSYF